MSISDYTIKRRPTGEWVVVVAGGCISKPRPTRLDARRDLSNLLLNAPVRALALADLAREPLSFAFVDLRVLASELRRAILEIDAALYHAIALRLVDDTGLHDLALFALAFVRDELLRGGDIPEFADEMLRIANNLHRG